MDMIFGRKCTWKKNDEISKLDKNLHIRRAWLTERESCVGSSYAIQCHSIGWYTLI